MPIPVLFSLLALGLNGCKPKPWQGKFVASRDKCMLLDFVEVHADQTADVKYDALEDVANFAASYNSDDSLLLIRELNKEWAFKWNGNDTLFEVSNIDPYCYLVKEK